MTGQEPKIAERSMAEAFKTYAKLYYDSLAAGLAVALIAEAGTTAGWRPNLPWEASRESRFDKLQIIEARAQKAVELLALIPTYYKEKYSTNEKDLPETLGVLWDAIFEGLIAHLYQDKVGGDHLLELLLERRKLSTLEEAKRKEVFPANFKQINFEGVPRLIELLRQCLSKESDREVVKMILNTIAHKGMLEDLLPLFGRGEQEPAHFGETG
jgi:hypothetical protein